MQHVGEPGTPEMKSDDKPSGGPSPVKAFFALLALLVAIGGLFLLTRSRMSPIPAQRRGATTSPSSTPKRSRDSMNFTLCSVTPPEREIRRCLV
jgi:hypothetical protein